MILKNGKRIDGSSLTSIAVVDDLLGGVGTTEALSANQGRILNEKIIAQQEELNNKIADVETVIEYISKDEGGLSDLPFIITDHKPGVYTFGGQYNNTCSSVYVKWTADNDTQWLSYSGIYFFTDTTDEGISKDIGFIIDWGDGAIRNLRVDSTGKVNSSSSWPIVMLTNKNQTISSVKTFTELPETSIEPTNDTHMVNKKYVDEIVAAIEIPTVPTNISAFTNDRGYITGYTETDPTVPSHVKAITTANIEDWNNKSEFSGSYNDLTDKPTIPTTTSALTNDSGFLTSIPDNYVVENELAAVAVTGDYDDLANRPTIPTKVSELENDNGYITTTAIPNQTSELINDSGFITVQELATVASTGSYNDLKDLPSVEGWNVINDSIVVLNDVEEGIYLCYSSAYQCVSSDTFTLFNDHGRPCILIKENSSAPSGVYFCATFIGGGYSFRIVYQNGTKLVSQLTEIEDILTSTSTSKALSANQGRILNEKIGSLEYNMKYGYMDGTNAFGWGATASNGTDMTADYGMTAQEVAAMRVGGMYQWDSRLSFSGSNYGQITYLTTDYGYADDGTRYNEVYAIMNGVGYNYLYNSDYQTSGISQVYKGYEWGGGYSGGVACFTGDTLVLTPEGSKAIKDIQVGDKVLSVNRAKTNIVASEISRLVNHPETEIYYIKLENGETIKATASHPFATKEKGKCNVRSLSKGNTLRDYKGNEHIIKSITKKTVDTTVYEIVVKDNYNYFVGTDGIQVYNEPSVISEEEA